jgi:hypothetical protein
MSDDVRFTDKRPRNPSRVIAYSHGRRTFRNVNVSDAGRPLIVCEVQDITHIKLDWSARLERGDLIDQATCTPANCKASITYDKASVILTVADPADDGTVAVRIRTAFGEVFHERLEVRLPKRAGEERRLASGDFVRGVV